MYSALFYGKRIQLPDLQSAVLYRQAVDTISLLVMLTGLG